MNPARICDKAESCAFNRHKMGYANCYHSVPHVPDETNKVWCDRDQPCGKGGRCCPLDIVIVQDEQELP